MATITGLTAARMLEIEGASVVDGDVVGGNLILTRQNGTTINAGSVTGPTGPAGPTGSDLSVVSARSILDVGLLNQIRAGRQLSATDFTDLGLAAPLGLWNLSTVADSSGNGRTLTNRGSVTFDIGINGTATTAARFAGSATQGLYIADTGGSDPFRIRTVSVGCWFRTAKRGVIQGAVSKYLTDGNTSYWMVSSTANVAEFAITPTGAFATAKVASGLTDVCDDRWHFIVGTFDGSNVRIYVDGILENYLALSGTAFASSAPVNVGGLGTGAATNNLFPSFGLVDEAFITSDVLSEDQIRNLYCAKIAHTLGATPKNVSLSVRRLRKGATFSTSDFPTTPLRLYNFTGGALTSDGSQAVSLTNNGSAVTVAGAGGLKDNAFHFNAAPQSLSAADTSMPSGTNPWSFGQWMKTPIFNTNMAIAYYGGAPYSVLHWINTTGAIVSRNVNSGDDITGPYVVDGEWHFIVTTAHNAPTDGVKRKLYVDGVLVGGSTVLNSIALGGANAHRIGAGSAGTDMPFNGSIDGAFTCDYALTGDQIVALYLKSAQSLGISPKNAGDNIEKMTSTDLFCIFDSIDMQHQIDLAVA